MPKKKQASEEEVIEETVETDEAPDLVARRKLRESKN